MGLDCGIYAFSKFLSQGAGKGLSTFLGLRVEKNVDMIRA